MLKIFQRDSKALIFEFIKGILIIITEAFNKPKKYRFIIGH